MPLQAFFWWFWAQLSCHKSVEVTSEIVSIFKPSSNARLDKFDKLNPFFNAPLSYTAIPGITYVMPRLFMCKDSIDFSNFFQLRKNMCYLSLTYSDTRSRVPYRTRYVPFQIHQTFISKMDVASVNTVMGQLVRLVYV